VADLRSAMEATKRHWQRTYLERAPHEVSWFEESPRTSLALISEAGVGRPASIIDVGGGASRLAGELLRAGYTDITVTDLSPAALDHAREGLGDAADRVEWIEADVRMDQLPRRYDLWHDRAVFHFMFSPEDRDAYLEAMSRGLRPGGYLVLATFGPSGPEQCSGLPVRRYGAEDLKATLGDGFELLVSRLGTHRTPSGREQQFHHALLRRADRDPGDRPLARGTRSASDAGGGV
jgi:ubiquinone/menaquinone biosynthesis C-methylase UbiE